MSIVFDINYLMNEIKYIKENNDENKASIKMKKINEEINDNYYKLIGEEGNNSNINSENKIQESTPTLDTKKSQEEEDYLPRIDELISDPYIFLLNSKLSFSTNNQIDMGLIASPQNTEITKDIKSPLSNLNILYFVTFWLKTKNFQNWFLTKTEEQNTKHMKLSPLNTKKESINKLYDYDNNEYNGTMQFGKRNGKGKLSYTEKGMVYVGIFINGLREKKGNLSSLDNKYIYDGEWKNDSYDGNGSLVTREGNKYVGPFKNGLFEGKGYLIDNEGNIYNGNFKNGKKNGEGEYNMNNGNKYIGMFKNDLFNGKGKIVDKNGNVIEEGNFKDGVYIPKKKKEKEDKDKDKDEKKSDNKSEEKK